MEKPGRGFARAAQTKPCGRGCHRRLSRVARSARCPSRNHPQNLPAYVWKHPVEDFYTGTQLIVHESQEAIFFMNGQALDLFGAGRYTLETQNLPLLSRLFNRPFGHHTPFHCEVYFINKAEQMAIKWGTDSKVEYIEPTYKFPLQIGASGEMSLRAEDSRRLLMKVVGTTTGITQQPTRRRQPTRKVKRKSDLR